MSGVLSEARYVLITRLTLPVFSFFLLIWIGRHSDVLLGQYALATTFYFVLQTLPLLGLTPLILRETARSPTQAGTVFGTVGTLAILACAAINLAAHYLIPQTSYSASMREAIAIIGWAIIPGIFGFLSELLLIGLHRARWVAFTAIIENILRLIASIAMLRLGYGIVALMWVLFATRTVVLVSYIAAGLTDLQRLLPRFDPTFLSKIMRVLPVYLSGTLLALVLSRLDYLVLANFQDEANVGYYAIAYRLLEIMQIVITSLMVAIFPRFSRLYTRHPKQFRAAARISLLGIGMGLILIAFLGIIWADCYVAWLFRNQYPHPVFLSQCFAGLIIIIGIDIYLTGLLNATDRQNDDLRAQFAGAAIYSLLLFLLVPTYGGVGALIALATATTTQMILRLIRYQSWFGALHCKSDMLLLALVGGAFITWGGIGLNHAEVATLLSASLLATVFSATVLLLLVIFRLGQILVLYWPVCTPNLARAPASLAGTLDYMACDLRAWCRWRAQAGIRLEPKISNLGPFAVMMHRISRFFWLNHRTRLARLAHQVNLIISKADLPPWVEIGPGLVLTHTVGTIVVGHLGANALLGAWCAIGARGKADIGAGPGMPIIGSNTRMEHRATLQGPIRYEENMMLPAHARISHKHQLHHLKRNEETIRDSMV